MQLNLSQEYKVWDNIESVQYQSTRKTGNALDSIPVVKRRPLTVKERATSGGVYQGADAMFLVPVVLFNLGLPKPADVITDKDGNAFTVLDWTGQKRDSSGYTTYKIHAVNLAIHYDLSDVITFERYVSTLDASKTELKTWRPLYSNVPCRVQRLDDEVGQERGIRGTATRYNIYLAQDLSLVTRDRAAWPAALGGYLEVRKLTNRQRIDELSLVEAELTV